MLPELLNDRETSAGLLVENDRGPRRWLGMSGGWAGTPEISDRPAVSARRQCDFFDAKHRPGPTMGTVCAAAWGDSVSDSLSRSRVVGGGCHSVRHSVVRRPAD